MDKKLDVPLDQTSQLVGQYRQWYAMSAKEIEQLKNDLKEFDKACACSDALVQLRTEITNTKNKLLDVERKNMDLDNDIVVLREFAGEAGAAVDDIQNNLQTVTEEVCQLYHHVCAVNGQTPNRIVLDHEKSDGQTFLPTVWNNHNFCFPFVARIKLDKNCKYVIQKVVALEIAQILLFKNNNSAFI